MVKELLHGRQMAQSKREIKMLPPMYEEYTKAGAQIHEYEHEAT